MDELSFQRSLRERPPADPYYRPRLSAEPGVVAPAHASGTPTMSSAPSLPAAARLAAAAGVVALFGGLLLLSGILSSPSEPVAPAATSPTPTSTHELLSSMTTVEVEPGVLRVDSDGIRPLSRPMGTALPDYDIHRGREGSIAAGSDGSVWWFDQDGFFRVGEPEVHAWPNDREDTFFFEQGIRSDSLTIDLEVGPDGTVWLARGSWAGVQSDDDTSVFESEISSFDGESWSVHQEWSGSDEPRVLGVEVLPDGAVWAAWVIETGTDPYGTITVARLGDEGWEPLPGVAGDDYGDLSAAGSGGGELWLMPGVAQVLQRYDGNDWEVVTTPDVGYEMRADAAPDGTLWVRLDNACSAGPPGSGGCSGSRSDVLARFDGSEWELFDADDGIPLMGDHIMRYEGVFEAVPDGSIWFNPTVPDGEIVDTDCDGVANFDGEAVTRYLRGMCIYAMDVAPGGAVWVQSGRPGDDDPLPIHTYVITPGIASAEASVEPVSAPIQLPTDIPADIRSGTLETPFGPARWVHLTGDETSLPSQVNGLLSTQAGYVVPDWDGQTGTSKGLWRSPDLIRWTLEDPLGTGAGISDVWQAGDTYWLSAVGGRDDDVSLWRSRDTESWERVSLEDLDPPGPDGTAWVAQPEQPVSHDGVTLFPLLWTIDYAVVLRELPGIDDLKWPALVEAAPGVFDVREIESFPRGALGADTFATLRMEDTELGLRVIDDADGTELMVVEGVSLEFVEQVAEEEGRPMGREVMAPVAGLAIVDGESLIQVELPLETSDSTTPAFIADEHGLLAYTLGADGLVHVHRSQDGRDWSEIDTIGDDADEPADVEGVWTWLGPVYTGSVVLSTATGEWRVSDGRLGQVPALFGGDGFRVETGWIEGPESQGDHRVSFIPDQGDRVSLDLSDLAMGRGNCGSSEGLLSANTLVTTWPCPGRREAWILTLDEMPA